MTFTDDDLERLKEALNGNPERVKDFEPGWCLAIIARLEAAECVIGSLCKVVDLQLENEWRKHISEITENYYKWRKAAGK